MCCWQLVFSFLGKSNILISFLQNSINKAYNGMAGACGVFSPGLSPPGAGKDLGCSVPGSVSRRLLLPFLAAAGLANALGQTPWSSAGGLSGQPSSSPPPPPPILASVVRLPPAALVQSTPARRHSAKPRQISPVSRCAVGHGCDVLLSRSSPSPGSERHPQSRRHPRRWHPWWWTEARLAGGARCPLLGSWVPSRSTGMLCPCHHGPRRLTDPPAAPGCVDCCSSPAVTDEEDGRRYLFH